MPPKLPRKSVIVGGGIAGIAVAYELAVLRGVKNVLILEEREAPLSLTSAFSTECYRNLWADAHMLELMNLSIDKVEAMAEASDNYFSLTRRGYVYLTGDADLALQFEDAVESINGSSANEAALGPARLHCAADVSQLDAAYPSGDFEGGVGIDVVRGSGIVRSIFPWIGGDVVAALHARRCGWFDAQQLGQYMLSAALDAGAELRRAQLVRVDCAEGRVVGVGVRPSRGTVTAGAGVGAVETIEAEHLVNAAGPYAEGVHRLLTAAADDDAGSNAPSSPSLVLTNEVHAKVVFNDTSRALPSESPVMIWADEVRLEWEEEMRAMLAEVAECEESSPAERARMRALLGTLPPGVHYRPLTSGDYRLLLWDFVHRDVEATDLARQVRRLNGIGVGVDAAIPFAPFVHPDPGSSPGYDDLYTEIVMRGLASSFVPALQPYIESGALGGHGVASVDGGYYTHAADNKPVLGKVPGIAGAHLCAAFSGFGVMAACGAAAVVADGIAPLDSGVPSISDDARRGFAIDRDYGAGIVEVHPAITAIGGSI